MPNLFLLTRLEFHNKTPKDDSGSPNLALQKDQRLPLIKTHFIHCLILVQPRKIGNSPDMTESFLTGT